MGRQGSTCWVISTAFTFLNFLLKMFPRAFYKQSFSKISPRSRVNQSLLPSSGRLNFQPQHWGITDSNTAERGTAARVWRSGWYRMAELRILSAPAVCLPGPQHRDGVPPHGWSKLLALRQMGKGDLRATTGVSEMRMTTVCQNSQAPGHLWKLP